MDFIPCIPVIPPDPFAAAAIAVQHNPANAAVFPTHWPAGMELPTPQHMALHTSAYWGSRGAVLTVGFMESTPTDLQARILSHMNAWNAHCNIKFVLASDPQVRITRSGDGYWSYLGTQILTIPKNQPTMCLSRFTMDTPEGEYRRVVRHETGHTLGFPHEHQLPEIIDLLDVSKTLAWGPRALGWSEQMIRSQILTPPDMRTIRMTPHADVRGIMCYSLPASITKNGQPIPGGTDIDATDAEYAATMYPKENPPPPPPPGGSGNTRLVIEGRGRNWAVTSVTATAAEEPDPDPGLPPAV